MVKSGFITSWTPLLDSFFSSMDVDVYFEESYVKLYETKAEKALSFYYIKDDFCLLFPFLRRTLEYKEQVYYDFETAYGYGGPLWNKKNVKLIVEALQCFKQACKQQNYIAGFIRFHPLLENHCFFDQVSTVLPERKTVDIDLSPSVEEIWKEEIHSKNRNVIKKAVKHGLEFHMDREFKQLDEFICLYNSTMQKLDAESFYYFDAAYYHSFKASVSGAFLAYVTLDDKLIAAALFFHSKEFGHYHLAGSDSAYLHYSPNNFLLWNVAKIMKEKGIKRFHLGGGTNAEEKNSLLFFKSRFSKHRNQFYIGKMIFNLDIYSQLCLAWEEKNPQKAEKYKHHLLKYKY